MPRSAQPLALDTETGQGPTSASRGVATPSAVRPRPDRPPVSLQDRLRRFRIPAIMLAGFVDGLNPCSLATIVFLVTLLTVSGIRGRGVLALGSGYVLAVFAAYLGLGLGVGRILALMGARPWLQRGLRLALQAGTLVLAAVSFRDAWVCHRDGRSSGAWLRTPVRLRKMAHGFMRRRLARGSLFAAGLAIGAAVTLVDAVCTGPLYIPTLALLGRFRETRVRALTLLVLYNLMFVIPLIAVMTAAWFGAGNERLLAWSRRHAVVGKLATGLLFAALALALRLY